NIYSQVSTQPTKDTIYSDDGTAHSQQAPVPKRLKIGLVLSGGGAKGFAHIGVLKVLEEAGVKIDYIGGTSMGAVVGGLYASGYNAAQIDSIFKATDFNALLTDFLPRSSKNFYEKKNDEIYAFTLPFNKFKIGIPTALSKGMYNYNLLNRLTANVRHVRDFNQLPIPFLCVASNIETGEEVVLRSGYLPQALLASSALPTVFSPVEIDGKWLVDGGVTNNYPVEEVRKMGADIIIGVDVQDNLRGRKSLKDATRILIQIANLQNIEKMKDKIAMTDIYIKPDNENYGVISFDDGQRIIKNGEDAAFSVYEQLEALGNGAHKPVKQKAAKPQSNLSIENITMNPLSDYTRSYIMGKLRFKPCATISYDDLTVGMNNISSTQNFSDISYRLEKNGENDDLVLQLKEDLNTTFLKFGLHYDGLYKSAFLVNITKKKSLVKNDLLSLDFILGDNIRYNLDYYIDNGFYWSFGFKSRLNRFNKNIGTDFHRGELIQQLGLKTIDINYSDFTNQIYLQTVFVQKFLLGAGAEFKYLRITSNTTENTTPIFESSDYLSAFAYLKYDSFDNKYFPKSGWYFSGDFQSYLLSSDYNHDFSKFSVINGDIRYVKTYKKISFKVQAEAGFNTGEHTVPFFDFVFGGYGYYPVNNFKHFYGYDFLSLSADSYLKSTVTLDYEFVKKNHLNLSANYANIENDLYSSTKWISEPKHSGYALGYGLETILGPIEIKYSWSPEVDKGFAW
ncbi:MAG TPA: patatin-like phospholipase family protein, partial [Flavobacterium sp.]|nr:patatin-like phospholipase family protein [Flavobacterium sp.]